MRSTRFATALLAVAALIPATAHAAVQPYGTNDAGGFRNVLPPGEHGTDNALDLGLFEVGKTLPDHFADQQPLYDGLLSASPTLTDDDITRFFKDATFGVRPGATQRTETPRPGVTILRDVGYGIPHIYGNTDEDVEFGAGYAAQRTACS